MKYVRILEMLLGAVFIFSAASKALDMTTFSVLVSYYGVVRDPSLVRLVAWTMLGVESILGAGLLAGVRLRGGTLAATIALLVGFSGLIVYAWIFEGLEDCGCFSKYIPMGPKSSLAKNAVLLAMAGAAWYGFRRRVPEGEAAPSDTWSKGRRVLGALGLAAIAGAALVGWSTSKPTVNPPVTAAAGDGRFAKYALIDGGQTLSLAQGEYMVALLSATCEHCQAAGQLLNGLSVAPGMPKIVALMMGDEEEMRQFEDAVQPAFPLKVFDDPLEFFELIGKEPPRFYIVRNGAEVRRLDALDPTLDELLAFATGAQPAAPAS